MVLLVTCYFMNNYGSKLQAYATQQILDELEIENYTVNYEELYGNMNKIKIKFYLKNILAFDAFLAQFKRYSFRFTMKFKPTLKENVISREKALKAFEKNRFRLTKAYKFDCLSTMVKELNAQSVIVGSDQLWLPSNIYADYYTLNFVPDNVKKISYATSFGVSSLDKKTKNLAKKFLNRFNKISVREKNAVEIIKNVSDKESTVVCDPTILFNKEKWRTMLDIKPIVNEKYIFCYFLGENLWHREWAKELKQITGLKIVSLTHLENYLKCDVGYADEELFDIGPDEFVSLISNAEYVCTDSFHGTVFSLLFHKNFYSFKRFTDKATASTNSRLYSLLEKVKLQDRLVDVDNDISKLLNDNIDYASVDKILEEYRTESIDWLRDAIGD